MSINNSNPGFVSMPQLAQSSTGQLYMVASHQHQLAYLFPRSYLGTPQMIQAAQDIHHGIFQHREQPRQQLLVQAQIQPQMQHQQQQQIQLPKPQPSRAIQASKPPPPPTPPQQQQSVESQSHLKDHVTSSKTKEKSIVHYIDGQMIIETFKPLVEDKPRCVKKRKSCTQKQHSVDSNGSDITYTYNEPGSVNKLQQQQIHTTPTTITQQPQLIKSNPTNLSQQQISPATATNVQIPSVVGSDQQTSPNDVLRIRAEMPSWSVAEVVKFIEKHEDIRQYSSKFFDDEVDGKALLLMIDRNLRFQILTSMFKHGPAMKIEAVLAEYKIND